MLKILIKTKINYLIINNILFKNKQKYKKIKFKFKYKYKNLMIKFNKQFNKIKNLNFK